MIASLDTIFFPKERPAHKFKSTLIIPLALVLLLFVSWSVGLSKANSAALAAATLTRSESEVVTAVQKVLPAVVNIVTTSTVIQNDVCPLLPEEKQPDICSKGDGMVAAATGFFITSDGYLATSNHLISDKQANYSISTNDEVHRGQNLIAQVVSQDAVNDIAILKVNGSQFLPVILGNSDAIALGQDAITISNALGEFSNTISKGIISGLGRSVSARDTASGSTEQLQNLIQTDAAINFGSSGGPLFTSGGEVIGMNTAVASANNIGFAVPSNAIKAAFNKIRF